MSSIRSILIQTSNTNIQKELSQLEHWLNNLPDAPISNHPPISNPDLSSIHSLDGHGLSIHHILDNITEELRNQRNTLNNILERIDNLEGFGHPNREVFIDEKNKLHKNIRDPWLDDSCEPLRNEVIAHDFSDEDIVYVPVYPINTDVSDDNSIVPDIQSDHDTIIVDEFGVGLLTPISVVPIGSHKYAIHPIVKNKQLDTMKKIVLKV